MSKTKRTRAPRAQSRNGDLPNLTSGEFGAMPTAEEIRQCMRVIDRFMQSEHTRTAWLVGFLMGSSLREEGDQPELSGG